MARESRQPWTKVLILSDVPLVTWCLQSSLLGLPDLAVSLRSPAPEVLREALATEPPAVLVTATAATCPSLCQALIASRCCSCPPVTVCLPPGPCPANDCGADLALPMIEADPATLRLVMRRALAQVQGPRRGESARTPQPEAQQRLQPTSRGAKHPSSLSLSAGKLCRLSAREREVGLLVAEGYSSQEIAARLFISQRTVEKHRANLMGKLGVSNAAALTRELLYLCWAELAAA